MNDGEVKAVRSMLEGFIEWARKNPPKNPRRDDTKRWEVALLSPYQAQRRGLRDMVRKLTGMSFETRFESQSNAKPLPNNASGQFIRSVSGPGGRCGFPKFKKWKENWFS